MLTVETLREFGANTEEGLARCMNNADFYLRMVRMAMADQNFATFQEALEEKNLDRAFEAAHALKGILGNLSLTPIYAPISEVTELLRNRTDVDYSAYARQVAQELEQLQALDAG